MGCPKEKVSFTVNDSSVSGKKEIRNVSLLMSPSS